MLLTGPLCLRSWALNRLFCHNSLLLPNIYLPHFWKEPSSKEDWSCPLLLDFQVRHAGLHFLTAPFFGLMYPTVTSPSLHFFRINNTSWAVIRIKRAIHENHLAQGLTAMMQSVKEGCCHWYLLLFFWNKASHQSTGLGTRYTIQYYKFAPSFFPFLSIFYDLQRATALLWNDSTSTVYQAPRKPCSQSAFKMY